MAFFESVVDTYNDIMINKRDPRVDGYFLMNSPFPAIFLITSYILFVKLIGPRLMRDRKPYDLKSAIVIYNVFQVAISIYIVYLGLVHAWLGRYSFRCQPVIYASEDHDDLMIIYVCWLYYICKFTEFLDTIFFVLRKKFDQITNLHVIHHSVMPAVVWLGVRFYPSGHGTLFGVLNTFVHVIMYTYYLLAAMGPNYKQYLWWKKYLTKIQMIQFVAIFIHSSQLFFIECDYPRIPIILTTFWSFTFLGLFSNFYIQAYIKRRRLPAIEVTDANNQPSKDDHTPQEKESYKNKVVRIISEMAKACYIGQNGLIKPSVTPTNNKGNKRMSLKSL